MFNAITLYNLDRKYADNFLASLLSNFDFYLFTFYGGLENKKRDLITNIQRLAQDAGDKIAFIDFLKTNNSFYQYLYGDWIKHCPEKVNNETKLKITNQYCKIIESKNDMPIEERERKCLESLFHYWLFKDILYQPCICFVNTKNGYIVKRLFERTYNQEIINCISNMLAVINKNEGNNILESADDIGNLFKPKENNSIHHSRFNYKPLHETNEINLTQVFSNFIDTSEDALLSLNNDEIIEKIILDEIAIKCTSKFKRKFKKLDAKIRKKAIKCIEILLNNPNNKNKDVKQIIWSEPHHLYRGKINKKFRYHFKGSKQKPIFINIGGHKLKDYGFVVD